MNRKCECYKGKDFIGRKSDYEVIKKGLETNPRPFWLQEMIKAREKEIEIDDVQLCGKDAAHEFGSLWICLECFARIGKYLKKFSWDRK